MCGRSKTFSCGGSFARAFSKCDPNVSVRRIEASFRKRSNSLSGLHVGIMAGMDQEAWFDGFDVVPRAVLLLVSQAPVARHHGRLVPQNVEVSSVRKLGLRYVSGSVARGFFFLSVCEFILRLLCCCSVLGSRSCGSRGFAQTQCLSPS